jgi:ZIP family zinc transporter
MLHTDSETLKILITALLIPFLGTTIGSAFVFFMKKEIKPGVEKALMGFAAGVMIAASFWSLLIPSIEMGADKGNWAVFPTTAGLLAGFAFLLLIDYITPHLHPDGSKEGPRSRLSKTAMLGLAVTMHNFPEGMAVGAAIAGFMAGSADISLGAAVTLAIGIAIQNIPEGAIISMPMRSAGNSKLKSFVLGSMSGIVEPIGSVVVILLASITLPAMPYLLAFAAGAMLYVVFDELIPEAAGGKHSHLGIIGFALGFTLMMVLDVVLG